MLLEMARLITIQQAEIDRLKALMQSGKKNKKTMDSENKARRLSLISKMYNKQWEKALCEYSDQISIINQKSLISGLSPFQPQLEVRKILENFK